MITTLIHKLHARSYENPKIPLGDPRVMEYIGGGNTSSSGTTVNRQTALGLSAFWRGVNLVSRTVAKVSACAYKKGVDDSREEDAKHKATYLLKHMANRDTTAFVFKSTIQGHALIHGNGYAYILRDETGAPDELLPLDPLLTSPKWLLKERQWVYMTRLYDKDVMLHPLDVLHIKGLSHDGILGYSVIDVLREMLGSGIAIQKYGAVFFRNNAKPSIVIQLPAGVKLRDPAAIQRMRDSWGDVHGGIDNSHKPAILEDGAAVHAMGLSNEEAQFLESAKLNIVHVANALNIPPHKLGDATRTSYASLENESQAFLDDAIEPWFRTWEQECWCKLLRESEKDSRSHYIEFNRNELVRADYDKRILGYASALQNGWMNRDEVRRKENMNPLPDGEGEKFFIPLNMQLTGEEAPNDSETQPAPALTAPADDSTDTDATRTDTPTPAIRSQTTDLLLAVLEDQRRLAETTVNRFIKRVGCHVRNAAKKPDKFNGCILDELTDHRDAFSDALRPIAATVQRITYGSTGDISQHVVSAWFGRMQSELNDLSGRVTADTLAPGVEILLREHEQRAGEVVNQLFERGAA